MRYSRPFPNRPVRVTRETSKVHPSIAVGEFSSLSANHLVVGAHWVLQVALVNLDIRRIYPGVEPHEFPYYSPTFMTGVVGNVLEAGTHVIYLGTVHVDEANGALSRRQTIRKLRHLFGGGPNFVRFIPTQPESLAPFTIMERTTA